MAVSETFAVFEDFTSITGSLAFAGLDGSWSEFRKSAESTSYETLFRGHTLEEVLKSDHDLLGREILASPEDPNYDAIAACLAPITKMDTYTFVGTPDCADKVGIAYGGRTPNFDPIAYLPEIAAVWREKRVLDGLVGDWLPAIRFVYPFEDGAWGECVMFAPLEWESENRRIQPVWYRVCLIRDGRLVWSKTFDTYPPFPPRGRPADGIGFYRALWELRGGWEELLEGATTIDIPDERLANQAKHSLVRAMMTRIEGFPKYGVMDRNYGGVEHDGFQDTFNVDVTAMLDWGLFGVAARYIDNYLTYFVRDDGSILYRGPQTGQYGRMLTVIAQYWFYTRDSELLLRHRGRIEALAEVLLQLRREALELPIDDPTRGMIRGWCEADSCLETELDRYMLPYFSNSAEAARGFRDLGRVWAAIDGVSENPLMAEGTALLAQLQVALHQSVLATVPPCFPAIAGATEPFDVASKRDPADPQFRAYRTYVEMPFSGCLSREQVAMIVSYRESHRDILLGIPAVYGYNSGEMGGFLSYGHAYGLLHHDFVREFLLTLYSLSAHQYTRGTWTAPETRRLEPNATAAPYCVPAQLCVPLLVRWMLVFEDPNVDELWLCKATPREWLAAGSRIAVSQAPSRFGPVSFEVRAVDDSHLEASVNLSGARAEFFVLLRLRVPGGEMLESVSVDGEDWHEWSEDTIRVAASHGSFKLVAKFAVDR